MIDVFSLDIDPSKEEVYIVGDIDVLKKDRFAWRYIVSYFKPRIENDRLIFSTSGKSSVSILVELRKKLSKYNFVVEETETTDYVLRKFNEEEKKFHEFSQKALQIRNNDCNLNDFRQFSESVARYLPARSLYPLQLLASYHLAFSQNSCNFSVPGAGKTSIVYGAYSYLHNLSKMNAKYIERLLIIGPLSSFGSWEDEYQECFGKRPNAKRLIGIVDKDEKKDYLHYRNPSELTLISYKSVVSLQEDLAYFLEHNKVMIVLDEAHNIKNSSGGITAESVLRLADLGSARVVLTGTPAPNGYEDLYNLFKFIWPNKNVIGFKRNQLSNITLKEDKSRVDKLVKNISPYFIRIRKSDLNIPPATTHPPLFVSMGTYQRQIYDYIEKRYVSAMISEDMNVSTRFKSLLTRARVIRLMQAASDPVMLKSPLKDFIHGYEYPNEAFKAVTNSGILKSIMEYESLETPSKYIATKNLVKKIISDGGKVVIWATFIHTIQRLKSYLNKNGIACQELYGGIPVEKGEITDMDTDSRVITREHIVREFQSPQCPFKVIIANPFAVAESISLHKACHNAIYIERSFNAAHFVQSKDRIHRYGLEPGTKTNYYYILSRDSIDETIGIRLKEKEKRMTAVMEKMPIPLFDNIVDDLGDEDIKALIKDYVRRSKKS